MHDRRPTPENQVPERTDAAAQAYLDLLASTEPLPSPEAIAYRADDDSFYIGGGWEGIIYHVAGLSDEQPGRILSQCASPHYGIAGLAWSPRGVLWQTSNGDPEPIYGLNPDTCAIVQTMPDPDPMGYTGAGVELDEGGNLWIVSQNPWGGPSTARLVETPVPTYSDVPWLSEAPAAGETTRFNWCPSGA